ncbi:hypothetical protein QZH41_019617 [Actinostola sp. cb2023]|nr:hypothetical protein QZH41_019617 [Actinostola sp. cb2023]
MADLLGDDAFGEETAEDPAAEFLAREQNDLADLGEDLEGSANADEGDNFDMLGGSDEPVVNGFGESETSAVQPAPITIMREEPESVKADEEEFVAERDDPSAPGHEWESVPCV